MAREDCRDILIGDEFDGYDVDFIAVGSRLVCLPEDLVGFAWFEVVLLLGLGDFEHVLRKGKFDERAKARQEQNE